MIITLGGHLWAGKSTISKMLATYFGYKKYSTWDFMRALAVEKNMSIIDLNILAESDGWEIDRILDDRQKKFGETEDNFVIEGRLAYHFIPHAIKVFLHVSLEESATRIYADDTRKNVESHTSLADTMHNIEIRRNSENERYMKYYGLHIYDMSMYDIVVDTSSISPQQVCDTIVEKLHTLSSI
jgi:predicted cytidylate kinase